MVSDLLTARDEMLHAGHLPAASATDPTLQAVHALAGQGAFSTYMTYARPGQRWFAGSTGAAHTEVVMTGRQLRWRHGGQRITAPIATDPLGQLGALIGELAPQDRRVFGYLAFDIAYLLQGNSPPPDPSAVLAHFFVPDVEVTWDKSGQSIIADDVALLQRVEGLCRDASAPLCTTAEAIEVADSSARQAYESAVIRILRSIHASEMEKTIVSRRVPLPFTVDMPATYALGLTRNTPARSFLLQLDGLQAAGFSPEIVAMISANGAVETQPLAGTRPFGSDPQQNKRWRAELTSDVKECFEHCISVRLSFEELSDLCEPGSVAVTELLQVKERGTVQHLGSRVSGTLGDHRSAWDALTALFPAVTASGIPKVAALQAIRDLEETPRGLYAGAVCVVGPDGELDAALALRTVFQNADGAWLQAGAGIVSESSPPAEFDETAHKLRSVAQCVVRADTQVDLTSSIASHGSYDMREPLTPTDSVNAALRSALIELGIADDDITDIARLRGDLELDSTEIVQISLEMGRQCGAKIKLESNVDYSFSDVCEMVTTASASAAALTTQ